MKLVWTIEYSIYCILIAPHPNRSSVTIHEGGEGRARVLWCALICAFKPVSRKQGNAVGVPLCRQGPAGTKHTGHGFKSPQHPSFGDGGGVQRLQKPGFIPCVRGACGQLVKTTSTASMPGLLRGDGRHQAHSSCSAGCWQPSPKESSWFYNFSSSISCHVNNSQCLEEKRVWEEASHCVSVMESWRMLSLAGTAKHSCRHWKQHVLS